MRKYVLDCWKLCGFWPYHPLLGKSMETQQDLKGVIPWIPVKVPGGVYQALMAAGFIEDPCYGLNSWKCEWVSNRWWIYKTVFDFQPEYMGSRRVLVLEGIDYEADIVLNGQKLLHHKGMYLPCRLDVTDILKEGENVLTVTFHTPPEEMGQIGYTSHTFTQKARFGYKWDFSSRLVNVGLYGDVYLLEKGAADLLDVHIHQDDPMNGEMRITGRVSAVKAMRGQISVECRQGTDTVFSTVQPLDMVAGSDKEIAVAFRITKPKLWYPNGQGAQPLYRFAVTVTEADSTVSDRFTIETGLRKVEYHANENAPADALPYTLVINDHPVYIKGVNIVPLDMEYGTVTRERYEQLVLQLKAANVNLIRIWGGGLIEHEVLYELCDRHGIAVWQEFIQSSSGLDNYPSSRPEFMELFKQVSLTAVKRIRNHGCHVYWCGGNELQLPGNVPIPADDPGSLYLKEIIDREDPGKFFLPTSAFGPREFLKVEAPGTNYDVHGPWKYEGVRREYEIFNRSDSLLHSEFGCDGLGNAETIREFIPAEEWDKLDGTDPVWRHHGEWWNTWDRDRFLFGNFTDLDDFCVASQFIQATALQYAIESNRSRAFCNSGTILWQANEPWPSTSGTNLIDYCGRPKQAYYFVGAAYRPVHVSMRHEALVFTPGEELRGRIRLHNDTAESVIGDVCVSVKTDAGEIIWSQSYPACVLDKNCCEISEVRVVVPECRSVEVTLTLITGNGKLENHYLLLVRQADGLCSLDVVKQYLSTRKNWC